MTSLVKRDHTEEAIRRLTTFFQDKPNAINLLKSYLQRYDKLEDLLFNILNGRGIFDAEGAQLDMIGALFDVNREARLDSQYRNAILREISLLNSDGTTEVFMQALRTISSSNLVTFFEHFPKDVHAYLGAGATYHTWADTQDLVPVSTKLRYYVDDNFDSFIPSELNIVTSDLQVVSDGVISDLQTEGDRVADLQVDTLSNALDDTRAVLPEIGEDTLPLAELLFRDVRIVLDTLVDEHGDNIVDEYGNVIAIVQYVFD